MQLFARLALAALIALFIAAPAAAVQPKGSAGWTTDGWVSFDGQLYAGPGTNYDETGSVASGMRVRVDRCSGLWCQIHTSSVKGWMSLDNLSFGQAPDGLFRGPKFDISRGGPGQVCFYTGADFTGASFCGASGRVFRDLALVGNDNAISSVEVGTGVSAIVCRDRGFRSYCEVIAVSQGSVTGLLSNSISSVRVY
ncbi:MAG: SH3 domain-containing protein [Devosia sp.]